MCIRDRHFIRITSIKNSSTVGATMGLGATDPNRGRSFVNKTNTDGVLFEVAETVGSSASTFSPTLGTSVSFNPIIDYEILDSKEFFNGILDAISEDQFAHYIDQGWPKKLLAMLLIEKLEVVEFETVVDRFDNDPDNSLEMDNFREKVDCLDFLSEEKKADFKYDFLEDAKDLDGITKVAEINEKQGWSIKKSDVSYFSGDRREIKISASACPSITPSSKVEATLRSIQGVIYYLGECLRAREEYGEHRCFYNDDHGEVFVTRIEGKKSSNIESILTTNLNGQLYSVSKRGANDDRTFSAISLVDQLLSLQQNEASGPGTSTIIGLN